MPYRGPPSKGCLTCRKRKIRCDQRPGTCLNCEKARRECGGYRDAVDMMFFDETQEVTRKMRAVTTVDSAEVDGELASRLPIGLETGKTSAARLGSLPFELESQAATMFFTHFTQQSSFYEHNESLFSNLSRDSPRSSDQALYNAILALGLTTLYHYPPAPIYAPLSEHAEAKYLSAVTALNKAISDAFEVRQDATLLAVIVLIMYETFAIPAVTSPDPKQKSVTTLQAWSNHVDGAAALLAIRGPEQFETHDGLRLFLQAAIPLCVNCLQRGLPLPEVIEELARSIKDYGHPRDSDPLQGALHNLFQFCVKFTSFWGKTRDHEFAELPELVRMAATLDDEAISLAESVLSSWSPRKIIQRAEVLVEDPNDDIMPLGYCHQDVAFNIAELSNGVRTMRMQINQLLRSILLIGMTKRPPIFTSLEYTTLLHRATANLQSLSEDVIASVPQYLGYLNGQRNAMFTPTASGVKKPTFLWSHFDPPPSHLMGSLPLVRSASGCHLPFALVNVAVVDVATEESRQWVQKRLQQIATECNIKQANALAQRAKDKSWPEGWFRGVCPAHGRGWQPESAHVRGSMLP